MHGEARSSTTPEYANQSHERDSSTSHESVDSRRIAKSWVFKDGSRTCTPGPRGEGNFWSAGEQWGLTSCSLDEALRARLTKASLRRDAIFGGTGDAVSLRTRRDKGESRGRRNFFSSNVAARMLLSFATVERQNNRQISPPFRGMRRESRDTRLSNAREWEWKWIRYKGRDPTKDRWKRLAVMRHARL